MIAVPFDTLKMARKLAASGLERSAVWGIAELVVDALAGAKPAVVPETVRHVGGTPPRSSGIAQARRDFTLQFGGPFLLFVWATLLGFSGLLAYR